MENKNILASKYILVDGILRTYPDVNLDILFEKEGIITYEDLERFVRNNNITNLVFNTSFEALRSKPDLKLKDIKIDGLLEDEKLSKRFAKYHINNFEDLKIQIENNYILFHDGYLRGRFEAVESLVDNKGIFSGKYISIDGLKKVLSDKEVKKLDDNNIKTYEDLRKYLRDNHISNSFLIKAINTIEQKPYLSLKDINIDGLRYDPYVNKMLTEYKINNFEELKNRLDEGRLKLYYGDYLFGVFEVINSLIPNLEKVKTRQRKED